MCLNTIAIYSLLTNRGYSFPFFDNWEEPILLFDAADGEKNIVQFFGYPCNS